MARKKKKLRLDWQVAGLVALSVLCGGVVTYALQEPPAPASAVIAKPIETQKPRPVVAFLGDSYTAGAGASQAHDAFTDKLSRSMGWDVRLFGQGGTGYTNPGQASENESVFSGRVADVIAARPDIVVVQGGTNDTDPAAVKAAATQVLADIKTGLPDAKIIAVGPVAVPKFDAEMLKAVSLAIGAAAKDLDVAFIDPAGLGWLVGQKVFPDGVHPNDYGHAELASLLTREFSAAGL